jgi:hypothetical protein
MSSYYFEVTEDVVEIAKRLISQYHPWLKEAKIGFSFRDEAPTNKGKITMGQASKVSPKLRVHLDFDFIIWLAKDVWDSLAPNQQVALVDHYLSHCIWGENGYTTRHPDIVEFWHIIERYGLWMQDYKNNALVLEKALQMQLPEMPERGEVLSVNVQEFEGQLN